MRVFGVLKCPISNVFSWVNIKIVAYSCTPNKKRTTLWCVFVCVCVFHINSSHFQQFDQLLFDPVVVNLCVVSADYSCEVWTLTHTHTHKHHARLFQIIVISLRCVVAPQYVILQYFHLQPSIHSYQIHSPLVVWARFIFFLKFNGIWFKCCSFSTLFFLSIRFFGRRFFKLFITLYFISFQMSMYPSISSSIHTNFVL